MKTYVFWLYNSLWKDRRCTHLCKYTWRYDWKLYNWRLYHKNPDKGLYIFLLYKLDYCYTRSLFDTLVGSLAVSLCNPVRKNKMDSLLDLGTRRTVRMD